MKALVLLLFLAGCCDQIAKCDEECATTGRCEREGILCRPRNDQDCARSANCRTWGTCRKEGDHCAVGGKPW